VNGQLRGQNKSAQDMPSMSDGRYTQSDSAGGSTGTVWMPIDIC